MPHINIEFSIFCKNLTWFEYTILHRFTHRYATLKPHCIRYFPNYEID